MEQRKQYPQLDLMKLFMAVLVVMIHTEPFVIHRGQFLSELYDDILRLAVPFFFMTSGFLLGKKCAGADKNRITAVLSTSIRRNLRLYLLWNLIYLPAAIVGHAEEGRSFMTGAIRYVVWLVAVGGHFYSWQMWYLLAMIYALVGMLVLHRLDTRKICVISLGIFLFAHMVDSVYRGTSLTNIPGVLLGNFALPLIVDGPGRIMIGMFYMMVGFLLAEKEPVLAWKPLCAWNVLMLLLSAWLGWWPVTLVSQVCFFMLVLRTKVDIEKSHALAIRRCSTVIYFAHMLFQFVWYLMHENKILHGMPEFLWTLGWSLAACAVILWADHRAPHNPVIKALF